MGPTIAQLVDTAVTLKYIGDLLLQSQVQGYECEQHIKAVRTTKAQFDQVNADVESHADYPAFLAEQRAKQEAAKGRPEKG